MIAPAKIEPLSKKEKARKVALERTVEGWLGATLEAAKALKELHDKRLWREEGATFEDYVEKRFKKSRRRAYQLIDWAEMCTNGTHVLNERQARALSGLSPADAQLAADIASKAAGENPSAELLEEAKALVKELPESASGQVEAVNRTDELGLQLRESIGKKDVKETIKRHVATMEKHAKKCFKEHAALVDIADDADVAHGKMLRAMQAYLEVVESSTE